MHVIHVLFPCFLKENIDIFVNGPSDYSKQTYFFTHNAQAHKKRQHTHIRMCLTQENVIYIYIYTMSLRKAAPKMLCSPMNKGENKE